MKVSQIMIMIFQIYKTVIVVTISVQEIRELAK